MLSIILLSGILLSAEPENKNDAPPRGINESLAVETPQTRRHERGEPSIPL